eukprot:CAMPEP_0113912858 /NCGR_PEP_ID=MMETSP0780_2-20120614/29180_1 /TAXON_ID=652834 /ORGANISM="Palpitomonas bilix" /LENGTH=787 /DNA_ID=CAMNT_0000909903 /DNA_START=213 /DNA_END=2576 /DNA_ORIENTATION=- /assembly_acc=CAM_ASM_000599
MGNTPSQVEEIERGRPENIDIEAVPVESSAAWRTPGKGTGRKGEEVRGSARRYSTSADVNEAGQGGESGIVLASVDATHPKKRVSYNAFDVGEEDLSSPKGATRVHNVVRSRDVADIESEHQALRPLHGGAGGQSEGKGWNPKGRSSQSAEVLLFSDDAQVQRDKQAKDVKTVDSELAEVIHYQKQKHALREKGRLMHQDTQYFISGQGQKEEEEPEDEYVGSPKIVKTSLMPASMRPPPTAERNGAAVLQPRPIRATAGSSVHGDVVVKREVNGREEEKVVKNTENETHFTIAARPKRPARRLSAGHAAVVVAATSIGGGGGERRMRSTSVNLDDRSEKKVDGDVLELSPSPSPVVHFQEPTPVETRMKESHSTTPRLKEEQKGVGGGSGTSRSAEGLVTSGAHPVQGGGMTDNEEEGDELVATPTKWMVSSDSCAQLLGIGHFESDLLWIADELVACDTPPDYDRIIMQGEVVWKHKQKGDVWAIHPSTRYYAYLLRECRDLKRTYKDASGLPDWKKIRNIAENLWKADQAVFGWTKPDDVIEHENMLLNDNGRQQKEAYLLSLVEEFEGKRNNNDIYPASNGGSVMTARSDVKGKSKKKGKALMRTSVNMLAFLDDGGNDDTITFNPDKVSPAEVEEMAGVMGVNIRAEFELIDIVMEAVKAGIPDGWEVGQDQQGNVYYFNPATRESSWDHPLDAYFSDKLEKKREESKSGQAADLVAKVERLPWREFKDDKNCRYFYNFFSRVKTRKVPVDLRRVVMEYKGSRISSKSSASYMGKPTTDRTL